VEQRIRTFRLVKAQRESEQDYMMLLVLLPPHPVRAMIKVAAAATATAPNHAPVIPPQPANY
jgi:hypothetical protein